MTRNLESQPSGLYIYTSNQQPIAFPLKHTEVSAKIDGNISRVEVTQTFENPFTTTLEATYIFPLPDEAAVDDMLIKIGDRTIQGSIKKRQEAQQLYEEAKKQGRTAGLLEQERDNIFTQSLANIQPGEQIDVIIRYTDSLKFTQGNYEFVFPMVVGPRYIPGITIEENTSQGGSAVAPMTLNQDTDLVPDASRLNAPILPQGMRSRHDINVTILINAGVKIHQITSPSHHIQINHNAEIAEIQLAGGDTIPNKDLILRYQVSSENTQTTILTQTDKKGGHFAVYFIPAIEYNPNQYVAKDVVFLIDRSGSQDGAPLQQCQELMRRFIYELNPQDTFSIIDFSDTTQQFSPVPLHNNPKNCQAAIKYINHLNAGGGTEMLSGIRAVLKFPITDHTRLRTIILLTDGYIGNENQILAEVQNHLSPGTRLHSFGAGSSVNRFLLNRIAELGRGISHIIRHDESSTKIQELVTKFYQQINHPILTNIQLTWEGKGESPIIYPHTPPDLFAEQPLVLFGRKSDAIPGKLHIQGMTANGTSYQQTFNLNFELANNPGIAQLWGRFRIKDLMKQMVSGDTKLGVEAVTNTALDYQLLSQYTAFIAISDDVRVNPQEQSLSMQVPVEMPEDVSYQGIFASPPPGAVYRTRSPKKQSFSLSQPTMIPAPQSPKISQEESREEMNDESCLSPLYEDSDNDGFIDLDDDQILMAKSQSKKQTNIPASLKLITEYFQDKIQSLFPQKETEKGSFSHHIQVLNVTGLPENLQDQLTKYLQSMELPENISGQLVFDFEYHHGRIKQLVLDQENSTIIDLQVIEIIRRKLLSWKTNQKIISQVSLTILITN